MSKAIIKAKTEVARLTTYAEFDLLGQKVDFEPGQYFFVTLKPKDKVHKDDLTHHFSIVNSPNQTGVLALATRLRLNESLFKRTLNEAKVGDAVEIGKIAGSFLLPNPLVSKVNQPIVMVALGIGITPFISMLRWAKEESKSFNFTLIYADNELQSMAFLDELKQLDEQWDKFKLIISVSQDKTWNGEKRHVDANFLKDYLSNINQPLYFVSGPPQAVSAVAGNLKLAGIDESNIKTDSFTGY